MMLLAPFAPHIAEELWYQLGYETSVHTGIWPVWHESVLQSEVITIVVQVNGKVRSNIEVATGADEKTITEAALKDENVQKHLSNKKPRKTISSLTLLSKLLYRGQSELLELLLAV
jgi:leucyl-tRNA synthetase